MMACLICLSGCGAAQEENPVLTRVTLDRGHGSMWGNQFYMDVNAQEILQTNYFSPDDPGGELLTGSGLPLEVQQWDEITAAVEAMEPLTPVKESIWKKLFSKGHALDGTQYHRLTLYWGNGDGVDYVWPDSEQAAALEALLEQLVIGAEME